jgi:hypothetical protein
MAVEVRTAAELIALDVEGRGAARRAARETPLLRYVLRAFVDRARPVQVGQILSAFPTQAPDTVRAALEKLDEEDLIALTRTAWILPIPSRPPRHRFCSTLAKKAVGATSAVRSTRSGLRRCSGVPSVSGPNVTTAAGPSSCRSIQRGPGPMPRASWSGWGSERRTSGGPVTPFEPLSTSSGRKSTCERGERQSRRSRERE